jgi:hypothetical protein
MLLLIAMLAQVEAEHAGNPVYQAVLRASRVGGDASAALPAPLVRDAQSGEDQREMLTRLLGSAEALDDFLRKAVTAPLLLKNRSFGAPDVFRMVDLWFVVYADLDEIDLKDALGRIGRQGEGADAGNMRVDVRLLTDDELKARKIVPTNNLDRYIRAKARLLDRIGVEATLRSFATRSEQSVVVASHTLREFDRDRQLPNRWWPIVREGSREERGEAKPYGGWVSYAKISKLKFKPGALLVESHVAFLEPRAWFDGAPILRSKTSLIAQDQIRRLRREIAKRHDGKK